MATRVLLNIHDVTNRCLFSCVSLQQGKCVAKGLFTRHLRRLKGGSLTSRSGFSNWYHNNEGVSEGKKIWKSFVFATTFSASTFLGATIWEYERIRAKTYQQFKYPFQATPKGVYTDIKREWRALSDGNKIFAILCGLNVLVFLAWRHPNYQHIMMKYFGTNLNSSAVCLPMVLSMFSHYSFMHLAVNMYVLNSFSNAAVSFLGREQFVAFYLSSGVMSSLASNLCKFVTGRQGFSLGASGAIMGVLAFVCSQFPDTRLGIILFPFFTFEAGTAIKWVVAFDTVGVIAGWQFFDHAAHLGGALFGLFWQKWGMEHIWRKRAPILTAWHDLRETLSKPRRPG